jgi:rRNA maturation protein Rpf1
MLISFQNQGPNISPINGIHTLDLDDALNFHLSVTGLPQFKEKWSFYFDETNNCGNLYLSQTGVNYPDALEKDFILGGIAFDPSNPPDPMALINSLNLQSATELKFNNISKQHDFLKTMDKDRVLNFLKWIENNDVYIHFVSQTNLYYSLVDIIDSIKSNTIEPYLFDLKDEFFIFLKNHISKIFKIMLKYNYPEIQNSDISNFCKDLISLLNIEAPKNRYLKYIQLLLKEAIDAQCLPSLIGKKSTFLVENYSESYTSRLALFKNCNHVFDNETKIESIMNNLNIIENSIKCTRYKFKDSKQDRYIQISDALVGILSQYYYFISKNDPNNFQSITSKFTKKQKQSIEILNLLFDRSDQKNQTLLANFGPKSECYNRGLFLELCKRK